MHTYVYTCKEKFLLKLQILERKNKKRKKQLINFANKRIREKYNIYYQSNISLILSYILLLSYIKSFWFCKREKRYMN